jgi:hypothetical protein
MMEEERARLSEHVAQDFRVSLDRVFLEGQRYTRASFEDSLRKAKRLGTLQPLTDALKGCIERLATKMLEEQKGLL